MRKNGILKLFCRRSISIDFTVNFKAKFELQEITETPRGFSFEIYFILDNVTLKIYNIK